MREVKLTREPIELHKILTFEGMAPSSGAAKALIAQGQVKVNGAVETQKRKLVVAGDIIEFGGATLQLTSTAAGEPTA